MGEKIAAIVNIHSKTGKAKEIWMRLEAYLEEQQIAYELFFTEYSNHATELAREFCQQPGKKLLLVMGGDGTLNEAINGMCNFEQVELGYIPTGSANDFAKGANITGDPLEILKAVLEGKCKRRIDVGEVVAEDGTSRRFVVSAGVGVDADVCYQALTAPIKKVLNRFGLGQLTYSLLTVKRIFTMPYVKTIVTVDNKTTLKMNHAVFVAAMNFPFEGGGIPMVPKAQGDDGLLSVLCAHDVSRIQCFGMLLTIVKGKHEGKNGIDILEGKEILVELEQPCCVHADGEHFGYHKKIIYQCNKGLLQLRTIAK